MSAASRWGTPVSLIRLEGSDTRRFLHGQSSQAIELAQPGTCLATCLISPTARMRGLALVAVDDTGADLIVIAGDGETIRSGLDRVLFPADNVRLGAVEPATLWQWQSDIEVEGAELLRPGVDLGSGRAAAALLQRSGSELPSWLGALPQWSSEQVESNRLHHGMPAVPGELNDDTNPFELGLADWVSLNKGCYVGQETLAKLATYDGVKQQLRSWQSTEAVEPGTTLINAAGERAGVVTSAQGNRGLALIRRSCLDATSLQAGTVSLSLSKPLGFIDPPVGAGGQG
ncbi:folate-binding protein YgfZ [Synechococcus sp. LTW-R]|uniref:CAF17-like 4Fe-4S cluster assembly/insertion protein YgfZ n=1 Tax=Synechococcus sp. LTW-R TaxID=2751170 RepID=UPI0016238B1E|nr:aminomethyltransferase [Synechococcus sp. LTW-R]QNG28917.1 aminomethyltransferase [Synechococcus sp. LTW-R]